MVDIWMKRNSCTKGKAPCSVQNHLGQEKKREQKAASQLLLLSPPLLEARQCIENSTCLRPNALSSHLLLPYSCLLFHYRCSTELSSIYNHLIKRATKVEEQMLSLPSLDISLEKKPNFFFRERETCRKNLISSGDMRSIHSAMHEKRVALKLDSYFHG